MSQDREQVVDQVISGLSLEASWVKVQTRVFTRWCNTFLSERQMVLNDLSTDLSDGVMFIQLLEEISGKKFPKHNRRPSIRAQKLENLSFCMKFLKEEGIKLVGIGGEDIADHNLKLILGLIWTIILRFQIQRGGGGSAKNELLEWVRKQIPEYNIKDFTTNWQDGKAIMALAESVEPGTFDLRNELSDDPISNCDTTFNRCLENLAIPIILDARDMVFEPNEHANMVYISYFRDYLEKAKERRSLAELEKIVVPSKCLVYGAGVEQEQECFKPTEFTIEAINKFGRRVPEGGTPFFVQVKGAGKDLPVTVKDNGDGTYTGHYEPVTAGVLIITVQLEGKNCAASPYRLNCLPANVDASRCEAYGPGLEGGDMGQPASFTVKAINSDGTPVPVAGLPFVISIKGPFGDVPSSILDNNDGTYAVEYTPKDSGDHTVEIKLKDAQVAKSPYHVPIAALVDYPSATFSYAKGAGLEGGNTTALPTSFTIFSLNHKGEPVAIKPDSFDVLITGPNGDLVEPKVEAKDTELVVTYHATEPGTYKIDSVLHHPLNPVFYDHIVGSPALVLIDAGTTGSQSYAFGPGLEDNVRDNEPTHFTIQACDLKGNKMAKGGDPFDVKITDSNGNALPVDIKDNDDGSYLVSYAPDAPGSYSVDASLRGEPIKGAPFSVSVKAGIEAGFCDVEQFNFVIEAKDKRGVKVTEAGSKFEVKIVGSQGELSGDDINVQDLGDGTYLVRYRLSYSGEFDISVSLNGQAIKGSPWKQFH